jgi:membrane protease subunit HflK
MTRIAIVVAVAVVAWLATGLATIRPDERGVVRRFGQVVATPGPGLWVGAPWGIDRLDRVTVNAVRPLAVGSDDAPLLLVTGDQNLVAVAVVVETVVDPTKLDRFVTHRDRVDAIVERHAESLTASWAATQTIDDVLLRGRAKLAAQLQATLPTTLAAADLGIVVARVSVRSLVPPEDVREAFTQVNEAQATMATTENQARQDASRRLRDAETLRNQLTTQSEATRIERLSAATAEADAFAKRLESYRKLKSTNPDILAAIWWEETGKLLAGLKARGRIELLDAHLGPNGLDLSTVFPARK